MTRRHWLLLLAPLALLAGAGLAWLIHSQGGGDLRADFELLDVDGKTHRATDWDGKVVVLNFWAPWCEPCREEMPLLVQLQRELGPQGLQIVGMTEDELPATRAYLSAQPVNYPILLGLDAILTLQSGYGDTRLPFSVVIDRSGRVRYREAGVLTEAEWRERLTPLITSAK